MAAEAIWQARGRDGSDRAWTSYSPARADREPIERLLRRLIDRVEHIDRRYGETLEELQARLGHYSEAADTLSTASSPEESDTLERLRQQLSSLADRLGQPKPAKRNIGGLETLNRVLNEAAKETDGIARGPGYSSPSSGAGALDFPPLFAERTGQEFEPAHDLDETRTSPDLDRQLTEIAGRLERSINDAIPIGAIESIDRRMRELALRFDAALEQSPRHEMLRHLEGQISGLGDQVTRVEQHMSRIGVVEGELQRLVRHFEGTPAQIADAARDAAREAARLVAGGSGDVADAAERLNAIHRDLVAMRDRSDTAGVRMVDTLAAVHDSLKALVRQLERGENGSSADAASSPNAVKSPASSAAAGSRSPFSFEHGSLGSSHGQGHRETADDRAETHSSDLAADAAGTPAESSKTPSIDDFVAAARRAAQAAAAERDGIAPSQRPGSRQRGRRKGPVLAVMASILLVIAAFLYVHLGPKLEPLILLPAAELISPAPARTGTATGLDSLPVVPAFRPEEPMPQAPVTPATNDAAPEVLPWRTETIPAEDHPLAVGQAIFPDRD